MIQRKPVKPNRKLEKVKFYNAFIFLPFTCLSFPGQDSSWESIFTLFLTQRNLEVLQILPDLDSICVFSVTSYFWERGNQKGLLELVLISLLPHWVGLWSLLEAPCVGPQAAPLGKKSFKHWRNQEKTILSSKRAQGIEHSSFSILWGPSLGISELGERWVKSTSLHCGFKNLTPFQNSFFCRCRCMLVSSGGKGLLWPTPEALKKELSNAEFSHSQHTGQGETKRHGNHKSTAEITRRGLQLEEEWLPFLPCRVSSGWNIHNLKTN